MKKQTNSLEDGVMTRSNTICLEVAKDVKGMMQMAVETGDERISYEKEFGTAFVAVEVYPIRMANGYWLTITDVVVAHEDCRHQSPRLTQAIKEQLPNFDELKKEYMGTFLQ